MTPEYLRFMAQMRAMDKKIGEILSAHTEMPDIAPLDDPDCEGRQAKRQKMALTWGHVRYSRTTTLPKCYLTLSFEGFEVAEITYNAEEDSWLIARNDQGPHPSRAVRRAVTLVPMPISPLEAQHEEAFVWISHLVRFFLTYKP
jgi:hypothetical protein